MLNRGIFRTQSNIYDEAFCEMFKSLYLFSQNTPSKMFDGILNTSLLKDFCDPHRLKSDGIEFYLLNAN